MFLIISILEWFLKDRMTLKILLCILHFKMHYLFFYIEIIFHNIAVFAQINAAMLTVKKIVLPQTFDLNHIEIIVFFPPKALWRNELQEVGRWRWCNKNDSLWITYMVTPTVSISQIPHHSSCLIETLYIMQEGSNTSVLSPVTEMAKVPSSEAALRRLTWS